MPQGGFGAVIACFGTLPPDQPLFFRLYDMLRQAIVDGRLPAGERLPATRTLARDLGISRTTAEEAYEQLHAEGFIVRRQGAGSFVARLHRPEGAAAAPRRSPPAQTTSPPPHFDMLSRHACFPDPAVPRAFSAGSPAVEAFPIHIWRSLVARSLRRADHATLGTTDPAGLPALREAIAAYLATARGVSCTAGQVIVTSSSQHALDLAARVLIAPGDRVWMEEPGYPGAHAAFLANGAKLVPVPVDAEGLCVEAGLAAAPDARAAYVTPSHQYPMGVTLSLERRLALLEWARAAGAWIIEDDYDSEFRYAGRPIAAVQGIDRGERVIYVGTFTKAMFPGLRLGYLIVPPGLVDAFTIARGLSDGHPPSTSQAALAEFFRLGHFGAHVRRMREIYRGRRDILVSRMRERLAGIMTVGPAEAGFHTVARLADGFDDREVSARLAAAGIDAQPLHRYCLSPQPAAGLFLGYAALSPREIEQGVDRMAEILAGSSGSPIQARHNTRNACSSTPASMATPGAPSNSARAKRTTKRR